MIRILMDWALGERAIVVGLALASYSCRAICIS